MRKSLAILTLSILASIAAAQGGRTGTGPHAITDGSPSGWPPHALLAVLTLGAI